MKEFYVEVFHPAMTIGTKVRVFQKFVRDALSPSLIALYRVKAVDKQDALAKTLTGKAFTMISPKGGQLQFVA